MCGNMFVPHLEVLLLVLQVPSDNGDSKEHPTSLQWTGGSPPFSCTIYLLYLYFLTVAVRAPNNELVLYNCCLN